MDLGALSPPFRHVSCSCVQQKTSRNYLGLSLRFLDIFSAENSYFNLISRLESDRISRFIKSISLLEEKDNKLIHICSHHAYDTSVS